MCDDIDGYGIVIADVLLFWIFKTTVKSIYSTAVKFNIYEAVAQT